MSEATPTRRRARLRARGYPAPWWTSPWALRIARGPHPGTAPTRWDLTGVCEVCESSPTLLDLGLCGPCVTGEADFRTW